MAEWCKYSGKTSHESANDAMLELKGIRTNKGIIYHCPHCTKWHISKAGHDQLKGKQLKQKKQKLRERDFLDE